MASSKRIKTKAGRALEKGGKCAPLAGSILANARKKNRRETSRGGRRRVGRR
jgi:hypothetical protein